jgi:hypothetical protein
VKIGFLFFEEFLNNKDPSFSLVGFSGGRDECLENLRYSRREGVSLGCVHVKEERERELITTATKMRLESLKCVCVCVCVIKISSNGYSY